MIDLTKKVPVRKWSVLLVTGYDHPDIFETDPQRGHSGCVILTRHQDLSLSEAGCTGPWPPQVSLHRVRSLLMGQTWGTSEVPVATDPDGWWVEVSWHEGTCVSHLRENARLQV